MHREGSNQLKKFQSLDWQASKTTPRDERDGNEDDRGQSGASLTCDGDNGNSQRLLKHSISIVVDLAKADAGQQHPQLQQAKSVGLSSCGSSGNSNDETTTSDIGDDNDQSRRRRRKRLSVEDGGGGGEATEEEDYEDDDDDEEGGLERCLISGLARRVVLVDEADKKFLRNRARSAEPQMLRMHLAGLWQADRPPSPCDSLTAAATQRRPISSPTKLGGVRSSPATGSGSGTIAAATATNATSSFQYHSSSSSPPPPNLISSAIYHDHQHHPEQQQQQRRRPPPPCPMSPSGPITRSNGNVAAGLRPRLSLASALATSSPQQTQTGRSRLTSTSGGGGGELAESGRLSMRRNTHHHVNFTADYNKQQTSSSQTATGSNNNDDQLWRTSGQPKATPISNDCLPTLGRTNRSPSFAAGQQHSSLSSHSPIKTPHQFPNQLNASSSHNTSQVLSGSSLSHQHNWPAQHRRQSLQFCLLTGLTSRGGAGLETGRSLTEEELRGEREFNEQVRNTARSPSDFAAHHINQLNSITNIDTTNQRAQQHQTILRRVSLNRSCSPAELVSSSRHNQTTGVFGGGGGHGSEWQKSSERLTTAINFKPQQSPLVAATSQIAREQSGGGGGNSSKSRRRVSFGCIDPIPNQHWSESTTAPISSFARKSNLDPSLGLDSDATPTSIKHHYKRASICIASAQAAAASTQTTNLTGCGILRNSQKEQLPDRLKADEQIADFNSKPTSKTMATNHDDNQPNHKSDVNSDQMTAPSGNVNTSQGGGQPKKDGDGAGGQSQPAMGTTSALATASNSCSSSSAERDDSRVESIMANAKLRQEEFARLLEEHEQIVIEINRFETKISNAAATAAATNATEAVPAAVVSTTTTTQTSQR